MTLDFSGLAISISELLKRVKVASMNKTLLSAADLAQFRALTQLVNTIDGLTFRNHFGEALLYVIDCADSVPGDSIALVETGKGKFEHVVSEGGGPYRAPDLSSNPTATSAPLSDSKPSVTSAPKSQSNPPQSSAPVPQSSPKTSSAPNQSSNPAPTSAPESTSKPDVSSDIFCVRTTAFWACDNEKCGADDLILELQMPSGKRKSEQIRYQCLKCTFIGTAELTKEEIAKAMKEEKRVEFEINKTNVFDFLNQPRPTGGKKKKSKEAAQADPQPGEPKGTPLIDAIDAGEQHMTQIAQEVLQSHAPIANHHVSAPQSQPSQAVQPPAIQSGGKKTKKGGTAEATPFQASQASAGAANPAGNAGGETPAAVKKAVEKVIAAQVSPSEVVSEEMMKTLTSTVQGWPLERLIKEWETMTGKVYKQGSTVPDAMVTEIVYQLAGVPMNV
jgi:hypothetical protein